MDKLKGLFDAKNIVKIITITLSFTALFLSLLSYSYLSKNYKINSPLILFLIITGSIIAGVLYIAVNITFIAGKINLSSSDILSRLTIIHAPLYLMLISLFNISIDFVGNINLYLYTSVGLLSFLALLIILWNINPDYPLNLFKLLVLAFALYYITAYIVIFVYQIQYPFETEWMEGGAVDHVIRVLNGQKLYVEPSLDFIPYIYTPFYFYVSALFSLIFGVSFVPLRLVSFLSTMACFSLIFLFVKRETRSSYLGIVSAGVFAATYHISGAWFSISRVDPLATFLLLLAVYLLKNHTSIKMLIISAVLTFLSFFTKQSIFLIIIAMFIYSIFKHKKNSIAFIVPVLLGIILSTAIANMLSNGWYSYYIFELPKYHKFLDSLLYWYWVDDILGSLTPALIFMLFYIIHRIPLEKDFIKIRKFIFYLFIPASFLLTSWMSRLHSGGYLNVLIPAYLIISIMFILGLEKVYKLVKEKLNNKLYLICICLICILQFFILLYNPMMYIPTKQDIKAGEKLVKIISEIDGEVMMPSTGYIHRLAGKKSMYAQHMAIYDLLRVRTKKAKPLEIKKKLKQNIQDVLKSKKYSAIITHHRNWYGIQKYYKLKQRLFNKDEFMPVTGGQARPLYLYVPKE